MFSIEGRTVMNYLKQMLLVLATAASLLSAAQAQSTAGRVLIAAGDVVAVRDGKPVALIDGSTVQAGDTIKVGDRSSVQLLMVDKAVLALRANSMLSLDAYRFDEQGTTSKSFFSLLQGGLRAVTGLIGKRNRDNFRLITPTATIGIRGTHFTVVQCAGNCVNADGSKAADGLFGGVTDGRVVVTNTAGDREFRKNEYFYVANRDTAVKPLPEPPNFLRDPQDARGRAKASPTASDKPESKDAAAKKEESPQTAAATPEAAPPPAAAVVVSAAPAETATTAAVVATTPTTTTAATTAPLTNAPVVLGVAYNVSEAFTNGATTIGQQNDGFGTPPVVQTSRLVPVLEYRLAAAEWTTTDNTPFTNADGTTTPETVVSTNVKTASVGVGSSKTAGNVSWGQYLLTSTTQITVGPDAGPPTTVTRTRHWAIGDGVESLPTTGSFTYNWIGGTTPTDLTTPVPKVGTLGNGGAIGVRFDNQTMSTLSPIQWSMPASGSSYSVSFQNASWAPTLTTRTDPETGGSNRNLTYPAFTAPGSSCGGCTNLAVSVSPTFYGKTAQGLGLAISTRATVGATVERTATVQVYQRP
jgi:hypothetical protein